MLAEHLLMSSVYGIWSSKGSAPDIKKHTQESQLRVLNVAFTNTENSSAKAEIFFKLKIRLFLIHKQIKMNDKSNRRRFGVVMTPFSSSK